MRMPEQEQCIQWACPTEEEMDKEMELMLVEKYWLGQIALKIWKDGFEQWKKEGYDEWYDECYDDYN